MTSSMNKFGILVFVICVLGGVSYFLLRKDPPRLVINEILANSSNCCPDTSSGAQEFDDWIEIYNADEVPVNIGGMYFSQNKKKPLGYQISDSDPAVTTIAPGGFLLLWADGTPSQGILHLKFKLDQDGEYLGFFNKDGRKIDDLKFGKQAINHSFGRTINGGELWKEFLTPTPGQSNH
ncbi:MAG: lamin tail domain-containing protein [Flammeovirgaceae bacterium]|nr:lamin tail domain-containing protein [Flammeovirgaceae bacterium]